MRRAKQEGGAFASLRGHTGSGASDRDGTGAAKAAPTQPTDLALPTPDSWRVSLRCRTMRAARGNRAGFSVARERLTLIEQKPLPKFCLSVPGSREYHFPDSERRHENRTGKDGDVQSRFRIERRFPESFVFRQPTLSPLRADGPPQVSRSHAELDTFVLAPLEEARWPARGPVIPAFPRLR